MKIPKSKTQDKIIDSHNSFSLTFVIQRPGQVPIDYVQTREPSIMFQSMKFSEFPNCFHVNARINAQTSDTGAGTFCIFYNGARYELKKSK